MGLFDKMKNFVTGGGAEVKLEHAPVAFPSMPLAVKVTVTAKTDLKSDGVFVDLVGMEQASFRPAQADADVHHSAQTYSTALKLSEALTMTAGEVRTFEGVVLLPKEAQPTFVGKKVKHGWTIRGRIEVSGNDPDSGFVELRVGMMA